MSLTGQTKRALIAGAHALHPIVIIGNQGASEAVLSEIDRALTDHEVIKVRIPAGNDKALKAALAETICQGTQAECLKIIGRVLILYRRSPKKQAQEYNKRMANGRDQSPSARSTSKRPTRGRPTDRQPW